jgi:hypothetical protein
MALPPTETWLTRSSSPKHLSARLVSPPPTTVAAGVEATAVAIARVPAASCGSS